MSQFTKLTEEEVGVWKKAIDLALKDLYSNGWEAKNNSTKFDVLYHEKRIPPKQVIRFVFDYFGKNDIMTSIASVRGGEEDTNNLLRDLGLTIIEKNKERVSISNLKELKNALDERFSQPDSLLKIGSEVNNKIYIWVSDKDNYFNTTHAHYEIYVRDHVINIDLHFEEKETRKSLSDALGEIIYPLEKLTWQRFKSSVRYTQRFSFNEENLVEDVFNALTDLHRLTYDKLTPILMPLIEMMNLEETIGLGHGKFPLNQILYGPPGTGKTYHTINKALSIIENKSDDQLAQEDREEMKSRYQDYVSKGQIVFTTFHQSMGYEDFVEGIKPQTVNEQVVYEVEPGIFKSICDKARGAKGNFDEVLEKFKIEVNQGVRDKPLTIKSKSTYFDIEYRGTNVFYVQPHNSAKENPWYPVNIENIRKVFETGSYERIYNATYVREVISYWEREYKLKKSLGVSEEPYVLIIDEINRGNVSAIFGELITLIEESKRAGASEALELTLPYSKEKFSVPSNLYIIGTMNTADRSVEALDTALRRRFAFEEMMPQPSKITTDGALKENAGMLDGVDLAAVLRKINERIEILLDVDHQIGHSYLINVNDTNGLANAFNNCIVPLLKEYFYHDDRKIALVLGAGFINAKAPMENIQALFPVMQGLEVHAIDSKQKFELKPITPDTIIAALQTLLNGG
ncbi:McrB family protein [Pedobacter ureilyticus]|uniref:AAA family ATPase n=1 Tax=Pedobacter ureilyticus TaxID=1393051 RepID=A0ABW9J522_9SPHI|nr:AAA family ATPase [Pedobacter helvus]